MYYSVSSLIGRSLLWADLQHFSSWKSPNPPNSPNPFFFFFLFFFLGVDADPLPSFWISIAYRSLSARSRRDTSWSVLPSHFPSSLGDHLVPRMMMACTLSYCLPKNGRSLSAVSCLSTPMCYATLLSDT